MLTALNKRDTKQKGQSGMDIPERLATLSTEDTKHRQTKQKTQHKTEN